MKKRKTINSSFKSKEQASTSHEHSLSDIDISNPSDQQPNKSPRIDVEKKNRRTDCGLQQLLKAFDGSLCKHVHLEGMTNLHLLITVEILSRYMGKMNESFGDIVLEKAPKNEKYTSPDIQKDVLNIISNQVRTKISKEIGDAKFCILVDEAREASNKEQMTIVLIFLDIDGFLRERFFAIVHVTDTTTATLKKEISDALGHHDLHIHNMRGQRYDGASNMRGSWNGLQALFLKDCSCAYYVHCFAHRLQLALTAAAEKKFPIECSFPWMLVDHVIESQDAGMLESVLMPFDIYNDCCSPCIGGPRAKFPLC